MDAEEIIKIAREMLGYRDDDEDGGENLDWLY